MNSLAKVIAASKSPVLTVKSGDKVSAAVKIMAEKNIGALLVMDGDTLVGIVSERDMVRKLLAEDKTFTHARSCLAAVSLCAEKHLACGG